MQGSGCAVVDQASRVPLDDFLRQEPCYLKDWLRRFAVRFLAQRPRSLLEPEDLTQEVVARLLKDPKVRSGGFAEGIAPFLGYLKSTAVRCAITAERRELGRVRCGNCKQFAAFSGRCLRPDHEWTHREVAATQDPRALDPACRGFELRRTPTELPHESAIGPSADATMAMEPEFANAVLDALVALATENPRAALVVRARLIEGKTYEQLSGLGPSVRTMKRDFALGLTFLRKRLSQFAQGPLAPSSGSGRYEEGDDDDR